MFDGKDREVNATCHSPSKCIGCHNWFQNDAIVFALKTSINAFDNKSIVNSLLLEIIARLQCLTHQLVLIPVRKTCLGFQRCLRQSDCM